jgi:hypothetical protein
MREIEPEAQIVCDALVRSMAAIIKEGVPPQSVLWGIASALGNLVQILVPADQVGSTLALCAKASEAAARGRALRDPPAGSA